jgi:hypothetical protein
MADTDYAMILRDGEYYLNERTGRTHKRKPAGGAGGGVTSYADVPASDEEHLAFLRMTAEQKAAESEVMQQKHDEAQQQISEQKAQAKGGEAPQETVNNPIDNETYGRPPQHVEEPVGGQKGPVNPADQRDPVDNQPRSEPTQNDPNKPFYQPEPQPAA